VENLDLKLILAPARGKTTSPKPTAFLMINRLSSCKKLTTKNY